MEKKNIRFLASVGCGDPSGFLGGFALIFSPVGRFAGLL